MKLKFASLHMSPEMTCEWERLKHSEENQIGSQFRKFHPTYGKYLDHTTQGCRFLEEYTPTKTCLRR